MKKTTMVWTVIAIVVILISYSVINYIVKPGEYDSFTKCLTEKGATVYGTDWCKFCQEQKSLFGKSFKHINYINCDIKKEICIRERIEGYPTWIINGEKYPGLKSLESLSALSGCELK